jgi:hypothetical protein
VAAQDDLTKSKDSLTSALIGHTLARLTFWSNMGVLMIKDNGQWEDMADARPK